jgi:asparagine synthase (glutamine-hydrolysing)
MSVQAGIWNFDRKPVDRRLIATLSDSLRQQGPDGESSHVDGPIALLYRPFHTTAQSRRENQPYVSRRGFVFTWDGRLDNHDDLAADLRADLGAQATDVAIVASAFERWENDCFRHFVGDWAVSVWRPNQHELIFATDHMAIRHIFYSLKPGFIWWSTDLAPLVLLSSDKFRVDDNYIAGYFANSPGSHLTPYQGVCQVPAGSFVHIRNGESSSTRYWEVRSRSQIRYKTDNEYEEHFRYVFRQSVSRRLRSDSVVLAELSGGLDSSSIVCMADDILAKEGRQTPRVDTISNIDVTEPSADDWIFISKIEEKRRGIGIHIDTSGYSDHATFANPEFTSLPGHLGVGASIEAKRSAVIEAGGYRVVLSGIGGDELLGGVPNPSPYLADLFVQAKLPTLAKDLMAWSLAKRRPWMQLLINALLDSLPASLAQLFAKEARVEAWLKRGFAKRTRMAILQLGVEERCGLWMPSRRAYASTVASLANQMSKFSPSSLSSGECRYPYLDKDFVEFILSIPAAQLLRPGERRSLMRRSLKALVPSDILTRKTKQVDGRTPVLALQNNWNELNRVFDSPLSSSLGFVERDYFIAALHAASIGKFTHLVRLLKAVALEFWLQDLVARRLLDSPVVTAPATTVKRVQVNA